MRAARSTAAWSIASGDSSGSSRYDRNSAVVDLPIHSTNSAFSTRCSISNRRSTIAPSGAGVAFGIWLSYVITAHGVHRLSVVNDLVTPALGIVVLYMLYMLVSHFGWDAIASAKPLNPNPKIGRAHV